MTPYTTHILAGTGLALAVGLAALAVTPQGTLRNTQWAEPAALKPELANPDAQIEPRDPASVSSFLGMLERPLFSPSRRPPPPPPPPKPVQQPEEDPFANIQLQGIYAGGSGGGILVRVDGKNRSLPLGAALGPWTIKNIDGREVIFTRGDETRRLRLIPSKLANAAPPPAPRAAAPGAPGAPAGAAPSQTDDPVRRQQQEQEEQVRARLQLMNSRRAANGLPPLTN